MHCNAEWLIFLQNRTPRRLQQISRIASTSALLHRWYKMRPRREADVATDKSKCQLQTEAVSMDKLDVPSAPYRI